MRTKVPRTNADVTSNSLLTAKMACPVRLGQYASRRSSPQRHRALPRARYSRIHFGPIECSSSHLRCTNSSFRDSCAARLYAPFAAYFVSIGVKSPIDGPPAAIFFPVSSPISYSRPIPFPPLFHFLLLTPAIVITSVCFDLLVGQHRESASPH